MKDKLPQDDGIEDITEPSCWNWNMGHHVIFPKGHTYRTLLSNTCWTVRRVLVSIFGGVTRIPVE